LSCGVFARLSGGFPSRSNGRAQADARCAGDGEKGRAVRRDPLVFSILPAGRATAGAVTAGDGEGDALDDLDSHDVPPILEWFSVSRVSLQVITRQLSAILQ
jgi:hypothetical protein